MKTSKDIHVQNLPNYRIAEINPETGDLVVVREGFKMSAQEAQLCAIDATNDTGIKHCPILVTGDHTFVCRIS